MDKRKWLWKRKSSERSSGETESSGSLSSPSERYSDEQESLKDSPNNNTQSPEVTSKASITDDEVKDSFKLLTEKLSAALVNVSAKEDLVKQHAKVAEEAVAGWEKAENEVTALKLQLEAAVQQNEALEVRASHLDGALKECVRQLRQAKEEQEQRIHDTVLEKTNEWVSVKTELENKILELQSHAVAGNLESPAPVDHNVRLKLEFLEKENTALKAELASLSKELEIRTFERELSTQAAETASKQQLESIKKVAKLEAECRRLQAYARKSSCSNDQKSISSSSYYVESLTDSLSDSGEKVNGVDMDIRKMSKSGQYEYEPSCSGSWASALIAELDQFKNEKSMTRNLASRPIEIDMMDDFLEMERLAASPETENITYAESCTVYNTPPNAENPMEAQLETMTGRVAELEEKLKKVEGEKAELEIMTSHIAELEEKLVKIVAKKSELERALNESEDSLKESQAQLGEAETSLEALQNELALLIESKELLEFKLISTEVESRTMAASIGSLQAEIEREQTSSAEMAAKCQELENELKKKYQEVEHQQSASSNSEQKIKQEDLSVAADKLAECQKTIASLGKQLQSLATLEDFLIDTANLPGFSGGGSLVPKPSGETWKLRSNETFIITSVSDPSKTPGDITCHSRCKNDSESPPSSSSSSSSTNHTSSSKSRNGFGKLFSRSKIGVQLDNHQE